jgi:hypothetical protein
VLGERGPAELKALDQEDSCGLVRSIGQQRRLGSGAIPARGGKGRIQEM